MHGQKLKSAQAKSKSIDQQQLDGDRELLVLGSARCGKSTFIKQLRLQFGDKFPESERIKWAADIYENLVEALYCVFESVGFQWKDEENINRFANFQSKYPRPKTLNRLAKSNSQEGGGGGGGCDENRRWPIDYSTLPSILSDIFYLWNDESVKCKWSENTNLIKKSTSTNFEKYYLKDLKRLLDKDYIPTIDDILFSHKPTISISEQVFKATNGIFYKVIDVAGQRSQRHKWISLFEGVTAIVFIVSLVSYSETTCEDKHLNSYEDSLSAFASVIGNQFLKNTKFYLLMNKKDLLEERLKEVPFSTKIRRYEGINDEESVIDFIRNEFISKSNANKIVQSFITNATDRDVMLPFINEIVGQITRK